MITEELLMQTLEKCTKLIEEQAAVLKAHEEAGTVPPEDVKIQMAFAFGHMFGLIHGRGDDDELRSMAKLAQQMRLAAVASQLSGT